MQRIRKPAMKSFGTTSRVGYDSSEFYKRSMYADVQPIKKSAIKEEILLAKNMDLVYNKSSEDMSELPDNSVHLMVTSPPYNVGKDYDDDLTAKQYRELLRNVWTETYRVLVDGGRACINVANIGRKPYIPLNAIISQDMIDIGFLMRGEIIWQKGASAGASCAWGSWMSPSNPVLRDSHEYILVFSKNSFSRKKPTNESKIATIQKEEFMSFTKSVWQFSAESARKIRHPAPFPLELPYRLIQLYTYANDVVLDPFMGSGTTALAAVQDNRHYVGYEISKEYINLTYNRVNTL